MLIFTLLFNRVAKIESGGVPYPLFVLAGLILWNFVSGAISRAGNSLLGASHLISKVYFPRLLIPVSNIVTDLADLGVSALLLVAMMFWYRVIPGFAVLLAPFIVILAAVLALGTAFWIAALNVEYRDIRVALPWVLQVAMYVTPVVYPLAALPPKYRAIAVVNPMTGIVEAFRASLLGGTFDMLPLMWSVVCSLALLASGAFYFRRMERLFADVL